MTRDSETQRRLQPSFHGSRVLTLESRRAPELAILIANYGGQAVVAPSLREVPLESNEQALTFAAALIRREYDLVVLLTGIGTRLLVRLATPVHGDAFLRALAETRIVARGPKPVAALRELGIAPWLLAPSPNTWHEVLSVLDRKAPDACKGARVAVQEYGTANAELVQGLEARGAHVTTVPIYQWALPDDLEPLRAAIHAIVDGTIDVMLLTSGVQLVHLLKVAAAMGLEADVRLGLQRLVVASIGPMTSEELRRQQIAIDFEATNPKMGFLVKEVAQVYDHLLRAKRDVS
jgi:uroporphyrinogen-III synthase